MTPCVIDMSTWTHGLLFTTFFITIMFILAVFYFVVPVLIFRPSLSANSSIIYIKVPQLTSIQKELLRMYIQNAPTNLSYISFEELNKLFPKTLSQMMQLVTTTHTPSYENPFNSEKAFAKVYRDSGAKMRWHYDQNYSKGKRFTAVIPLLEDPGNTSHLLFRLPEKGIVPSQLKEGLAVIFEGDKVFHHVTPQAPGALRVSLIIVFYDTLEQTNFQQIASKVGLFAKRFFAY